MATVKKAQKGKNVPKGMVPSEMFPGKMIPKAKSNYATGEYSKMLDDARRKTEALAKSKTKMKTGGKAVKKAKSGGSFPDLNKDGKVTKADILKGRGVIARKGAKVAKSSGMKKCKYGCK
jgi:hypothetical protein